MKEYYDILGINENATPEEIKKAYRKKAFETHPDRNSGKDEEFKKVNEAYEFLTNKNQTQELPFDPSDIFRNINFSSFWRPQPEDPPKKDNQIRLQLNLSIEDLKSGRDYTVEYVKAYDCASCNGVGGSAKTKCTACNGVGGTPRIGNGFLTFQACQPCQGSGIMIENVCKDCSGAGYSLKKEALNFEIKEKK